MVEPTGYTALDLIGFTDKGSYDPLANYVRNDLVHVGNSTWRCKIDDTTGITPTEGANWTIFIESATSLTGMDDTDITSPKDGDLVQFNSTSNKWKNSHDVWDTMAQNGAHNLFPCVASLGTREGITVSKNGDGTALSGTASGNPSMISLQCYDITTKAITDAVDARMYLKPNKYILSIANALTINIKFKLYGFKSNAFNSACSLEHTFNAGVTEVEYDISSWTDYDEVRVCLIVSNTVVIPNNTIIYPMIRLASDPNTDYTPYAPINRDCMSYAVNTKLGAHNMLDSSVITQTINGIVFTVTRVCGFITEIDANGTVVDNNAQLFLRNRNDDYLELPVGSYIGSGCPSGGSDDTYHMRFIQTIDNQAVEFRDYGNGVEFNVTNVNHMGVTIYIKLGTIVNHKKFYPMIRLSTDNDPTFAPYAMTNRELTNYIIKKTVTTSSISFTANTEKSGLYELTSDIPTGYIPFGIVGYNINIDASVRRLRVYDYTGTWNLEYSVKTTTTISTQLIVDILFVKK